MTRGHVHGAGPAVATRPYLIRAWEALSGEWTGEVWSGAALIGTARGQCSREDALAAAERGLTVSFRDGIRLRGEVAHPSGEVRIVARNGRGVEVAAWVSESATRVERIDRFTPDCELVRESGPGGTISHPCRFGGCKNNGQFDGWCYFHREQAASGASGFRRSLCDCGECEECARAATTTKEGV